MKKLFLILTMLWTATITGYSQDSLYTTTTIDSTWNGDMASDIPMFAPAHYTSKMSELLIVKLLLQYEKEARQEAFGEYFKDGMSDTIPTILLVGKLREQRHKEPTFAGFLHWIRNKYELPLTDK